MLLPLVFIAGAAAAGVDAAGFAGEPVADAVIQDHLKKST